eukprot:TRINITY_DN1124_c0_g1_i1.p1 TRINITY_DN1124_c0_g1~~TRINITY_DN1124_c0_g1_i1.p1  ORF type:complete len:289 (-),score=55.25 TRINITY_DN1124_c0_g1_i1:38-904(-)
MVNYWTTFRKTRTTAFPKFSLLDKYRKAVGADLSYRTRWFDTALMFPPDAVRVSSSKKLPDRYTLENKLMSLWLDKYPNLLRVPITSDVGTNLFIGLHPLHWLVAEQKKLITGPAQKSLTESFNDIEKKLKEIMSRRHLERRIQATQAVESGARRGQLRWKEPIEWVSWAATEGMTENQVADDEPFLFTRQANSPIYLSERWTRLMQVIKMTVLEADENGQTRKITEKDLPLPVVAEDVATFVEYYPQYTALFDEQLLVSKSPKDLLQDSSTRAKVFCRLFIYLKQHP